MSFDRPNYEVTWSNLNQYLGTMETATGMLNISMDELYMQQCTLGFIRDDLSSVSRYRFPHPKDRSRFFFVQYNPTRALRFNGAGEKIPPPGEQVVHNGCFLCRDNILWQQRGMEIGYYIDVGENAYIAWMNPYPLMPLHVVIAADQHIPQNWALNGTLPECRNLETLLGDLVNLSTRLPGYIGFYNGVGAGASIPSHLHFQFFKRPEPHMQFPLEQATGSTLDNGATILNDYPLPAVCWRGDPDALITAASRWIGDWTAQNQHRQSRLSANIITTTSGSEQRLYFIPRDQLLSHSPELSGMIGGLEVLGELVFSSPEEKCRLDAGEVDYHTVARILAAARISSEL